MYTKSFGEISKDDIGIAGGKGASLGEMTSAGFAVPDGFVILVEAFDKYINDSGIRAEIESALSKVKLEDINSVNSASEKINALILGGKIEEDLVNEINLEFGKLECDYVAVRSSATSEDSKDAAWAGQLDSFLNTKRENLIENVKRCWASIFSPRAIFYRFENGLHKLNIGVAVVVQKMIQSEISGIAFSVHPVTEDKDQIVIEAGLGLGKAVVSGTITPDSYVVSSKYWKILNKNINVQEKGLYLNRNGSNKWRKIKEEGKVQFLNDQNILKLAKIVSKIEWHYGVPVDVEWALEDGYFFIIQSRPITTLKNFEIETRERFIKIYNRPLPLLAIQIYEFAERKLMKNISPTKYYMDPAYHYISKFGVEVYYNFSDPGQNPDSIIEYFNKHVDILRKLKLKLYEDCDRISCMIKESDFKDCKKIFDITSSAWPLISLSTMLGDERGNIKGVSEETVKEYREIRNKCEWVVSASVSKILENYNKKFPEKNTTHSRFLLIEEILSGEIPPIDKINKRKLGYIYHRGNLFTDISLEDYGDINNIEFSDSDLETASFDGDISGEAVCPGKVKGKVCVLFEIEDIKKVNFGDIIVSPMTTPDFLPAMKNAHGIITDEGGITCHAAIVARELKKPCITGTKIATKILKDGDLVEVDGDNGVVRILKKA